MQVRGSVDGHDWQGNMQLRSGTKAVLFDSTSILNFGVGSAYVLMPKPVPSSLVNGFCTLLRVIVTDALYPSKPVLANTPLTTIVRAASLIVHELLYYMFVWTRQRV